MNDQPNTIDGSLIKSTNVPHRAGGKKTVIYVDIFMFTLTLIDRKTLGPGTTELQHKKDLRTLRISQ